MQAAVPLDPFRAIVHWPARPKPAEGPLAGLTYAAKDCLDIAGRAPGCGLAPFGGTPAPLHDAAVIQRLEEAGAHLVAMAQMTPLAFEPSGENAALGRPLNPRNADRVCGGSSSGSAVAVAAGQVDFAIGTDTAGSIRIPAHCCGIAGWKPTNRLIPDRGVMPLAESLDCVGFLAADAAMLGRIAAVCGARPVRPFTRLVLARDAMAQSAPAIADAVDRAARMAALDSRLPLREVALLPLLDACDAPVFVLLGGEAFRAHQGMLSAGTLDPALARRLGKGGSVSEADLALARQQLAGLAGSELPALLGEDDVMLVPGMPIETPLVSECAPDSAAFSARTLYALSAYTRFANGLGLPVVSIPVGKDSHGLPVGMQLVAQPGRDADLIALAVRLAACLATTPEPTGLPT